MEKQLSNLCVAPFQLQNVNRTDYLYDKAKIMKKSLTKVTLPYL